MMILAYAAPAAKLARVAPVPPKNLTLENLALRQQLAILHRKSKRP